VKSYTYLIIGGGVAAARAVEGIREIDTFGSILMVSEEEHLPYDRPPLSKAALSQGLSISDISIHSSWHYLLRRARVKRRRSVVSLDLATSPREARLSDGSVVGFKKAIIATGARPRALDISGCELSGYDALRSYEDSQRIRHELLRGGSAAAKRVVIVGAGFIGLEAAASIASLGAEVTVLEIQGQLWPSVAPATLATFLQERLVERGVSFRFGSGVSALEGEGQVEAVLLEDGTRIPADLVLFAVGVRPNQEIAEEAGLSVEDGVLVDQQLRTSSEDVWAAGDVARLPDPYAERSRRLEHYGGAEATGYVAGKNAAGGNETFNMLPYVWSDIGELRVDIAGDEGGWEEPILRGSAEIRGEEKPSFIILGTRDNRLVSYFAVNSADADRSALQLLIKQRVDLRGRGESLADLSRPLQQVVAEALAPQ
jgi:3-phenylpropionate/trans-cinnamate dioxygenase ferredoxin reductase subunit